MYFILFINVLIIDLYDKVTNNKHVENYNILLEYIIKMVIISSVFY